MNIEVSNLENDIKLIQLEGRLDLKGTNEIDDKFSFSTSSGSHSVLVDLSAVEYIASIGMRMLIMNARAVTKRGKKMVLFNPTPLVKEALTTAGFADLIPMYDDFNEACEDLLAV